MNLKVKLGSYPFIHNSYEKVSFIFEEYIKLLPFKYWYLLARMKNGTKKTILCYPEKPVYYHKIHQICNFNGFNITNKPQKADLVIHFEDTTFRKYDKVLKELKKKYTIINYRCWDISKKKVDKIQKKVFGYGISINPQTYKGEYVKKGNINSLHNGVVLAHPEKPEPGYVYQKLINNIEHGQLVVLRFPVFGDNIPYVFCKYRPIKERFRYKNNLIKIVKPATVFSPNEYKKILEFRHLMGLDCGDLEILRDKDTKKLYIIDVNNTPAFPPRPLSMKECKRVLQIMSDAFQQAFL